MIAKPELGHLVIRKPIYAALLGLLLAVLGLSAVLAVPLEQAPEVTIGVMIVSVVYPGAGPEDIEREVTRPLEDALRGVRNVSWVQSVASDGVNVTTLRFADGADMDLARRDVKRGVELAASELPVDADAPVIREMAFDDVPIVYISLSGPTDPVVLRELAEQLRDRVEAVVGISDVEIFGGAEREVRVRVDPERMRALSVDLTQVAGALKTQSRSAPAGAVNVGAHRRFAVRTEGAFSDLEAVGEVVVATGRGAPIPLRDIATIRMEPERRKTASAAEGVEGVTLLVRKEKGVSTIPAAEAAKKIARSFAQEKGLRLEFFFEQRRYIERMLEMISRSAIGGMFLVLLVLAAFLGLRLGFLIAMSIPISLITAVVGLWFLGDPLSGVAVFGLVLVLGMVVDGAIVVGEVIDRRWREGDAPPQAADGALSEVGRPIISAALTTMAAFVPMMFMPGVPGQFIAVLPLVVTLALCGSLLADHLLLPAAYAFITARRPRKARQEGSALGDALIERYAIVLERCLKHKFLLVLGCIAAIGLAVGVVVAGALGFEFFPRADTGVFWVDVKLPPGSRLEDTEKAVSPIEARVAALSEVDNRVITVGDSGRLSADVNARGGGIGPQWGRINVELVGPFERDAKQFELVDQLRQYFKTVVNAEISVGERQEGPPQGAPIAIRVQGDDFGNIRRVAKDVEFLLRAQPGARSVRSDLSEGRPEFQVEMLGARSGAVHGLTAADVGRSLQLAVFGVEVARFVDQDDSLKVRLTLGDGEDLSLEQLKRLPMRTRAGAIVPLSEVAKIRVRGGFSRIIRRDFKRTITIRSEVAEGVTSDKVRNAVRKGMKSKKRGSVHIRYEGDNVERDRSFVALLEVYPVALVLIFIILVAQFGSFTQPLCVVAMIPLSFIGAVLGLAVLQKPFGFMSGVGLVALSGIVVNDAIVMVDAINVFRAEGQPVFEAALSAGRRRFRAVWLTTLTTFGGLSPFALKLTDGAELWQPLAITICSGLLMTTVLILLVLPGFYMIVVPLSEETWGRFKRLFSLGLGYEKK